VNLGVNCNVTNLGTFMKFIVLLDEVVLMFMVKLNLVCDWHLWKFPGC